MPPTRTTLGRAPKACSLCRRYKARCHPLDGVNGPLQKLESLVAGLESRLDAKLDDAIVNGSIGGAGDNSPLGNSSRRRKEMSSSASSGNAPAAATSEPVPVLFIRDAAANAGVHSTNSEYSGPSPDVIASGAVSVATAQSLMHLFRVHYGRWVRFEQDGPVEHLVARVRRSPLLLASIFLIAVRHTHRELADQLAPGLFRETKKLLAASLLDIPKEIEYFQAALILSLWSTTIGQTPLSIDSWLLTTYAVKQGLASPVFSSVLQGESGPSHVDAWCIWNHLCLAHLQYCVGTRRRASLTEKDVDRCAWLVENSNVGNFEERMAAEIRLYWVTYQHYSVQETTTQDVNASLESWKQEWAVLFCEFWFVSVPSHADLLIWVPQGQPRAQFLQMGYHFSRHLVLRQTLRAPGASMNNSLLQAMIHDAKAIIDLAIHTTDERTRHLTDHIYHMLAFSALTICQLVKTYEAQLGTSTLDVSSLAQTISELIYWLRSIGLPCHAAHMLSDIVEAQFNMTRHAFQRRDEGRATREYSDVEAAPSSEAAEASFLDFTFLYPEFIGSDLFDGESQTAWPQWN
ncbi:GAL4 [Geosmithia morbida]|uniref:GAL4 n=1 Tax=Geosmithia morbida TaxID=1094350 RepID=A0A9P4YU97_9HYPO|nr:GAL4 [Geosmithia morbida]KAF4121899.1 GAL4 [Geosmithia morbida]